MNNVNATSARTGARVAADSVSPATADVAGGGPSLPDRQRIHGWLLGIDPALNDTAFESLWQHAGADDAARGERLFISLSSLLLGRSPAAGGSADPATQAADLDAFVADPSHHAQVIALGEFSSAELSALARSDTGMRIALAAADPLALLGNRHLFAAANADAAYDRFSADSGEQLLSDAWIDDRAKYVAWQFASADERAAATADGAQWTFVDRGVVGADGAPSRLVLGSGTGPAADHQVVFGTIADDLVNGGAGTDRLHGELGSDVLRGGDGADLLDGGSGQDLLLGGAGGDDLDGGAGDDELDGGRGADRLDGGAGDDVLFGGRGDDWLAGGRGHDTYVIDAGDGHDTLVDADGDGTIVWNGEALGGAALRQSEGSWSLGGGRYVATFAGDSTAGGLLTLREAAAVDGEAAAAGASVQVRGWHDGDFGITLAADAGAAAEPAAAEITGSPAIPTDPGTATPVAPDAVADWEAAYASLLAGWDVDGATPNVRAPDYSAVMRSLGQSAAASAGAAQDLPSASEVSAPAGDAGAPPLAIGDVAAALASGHGDAGDTAYDTVPVDSQWSAAWSAHAQHDVPGSDRHTIAPGRWPGVASPPAMVR